MKPDVLDLLRGGLIVSCQAYPGEPLRAPDITVKMVQSVAAGGAHAVRVEGLDDIRAAVELATVPVIGIVKRGVHGVTITPTAAMAIEVAALGVEVVAIDGTRRPRPDGLSLAATVERIRNASNALIMADCGSLGDAHAAEDAGIDLVGTTLAGYTGERALTKGPDEALVAELVETLTVAVIAEGRIETPEQCRRLLDIGAFAVCVGSAITHPTRITRRFVESIEP